MAKIIVNSPKCCSYCMDKKSEYYGKLRCNCTNPCSGDGKPNRRPIEE